MENFITAIAVSSILLPSPTKTNVRDFFNGINPQGRREEERKHNTKFWKPERT